MESLLREKTYLPRWMDAFLMIVWLSVSTAVIFNGCSGSNGTNPQLTPLTKIAVTTSQDDELWIIDAAELQADVADWHIPAGMTFSLEKGKYNDGLFMGEIQQQRIGELAGLFGLFGFTADLGKSMIAEGVPVASLKATGELATSFTELKKTANPVSLSLSFIQVFEALATKIQNYDKCLILGPGDKVTFSIPASAQEKPNSVRIRYALLNWRSISQEEVDIQFVPECVQTPSFPPTRKVFAKWVADPSPRFSSNQWNFLAGPVGGLSYKWALLNLDANPVAWDNLICGIRPTLPELRSKYVTTSEAVVERASGQESVVLTLPSGAAPGPDDQLRTLLTGQWEFHASQYPNSSDYRWLATMTVENAVLSNGQVTFNGFVDYSNAPDCPHRLIENGYSQGSNNSIHFIITKTDCDVNAWGEYIGQIDRANGRMSGQYNWTDDHAYTRSWYALKK